VAISVLVGVVDRVVDVDLGMVSTLFVAFFVDFAIRVPPEVISA
jgi:hypothetical protein